MKPLVIYYSHSGNTRGVAQALAGLTGAGLLELQPARPYPAAYNAVVEQAKREIQQGFLPELQPLPVRAAGYGPIFVGTPNWWSTMAPPVAAFLRENDLSGKRVLPFCTHGGGGIAHIGRDIERACPNSQVGAPFDTYGSGGGTLVQKLRAWLESQGISIQE